MARLLVVTAEHHEAELALRCAYWQDGHDAGYRAGWRDGTLAVELLDTDPPQPWPVAIDPELDRRRYPPHGRRRFAEPRPGDFLGLGVSR